LIRSPTFHRGVRAIEKKVREVRHGKDPEEMGGVKTDRELWNSSIRTQLTLHCAEEEKGVFRYFFDELKEQSKGITKNKR
jgi:hypothetical protein